MYNNFLQNFDSFKQSPKTFLFDLSHNIVQELNKQSNTTTIQVNLEHLRQSLIRFLEQAIGKLIWSPQDHENIWPLFYRTTKKIDALSNIADDMDNIDDLYWSLIHRFCFFLDVTGHEIPTEFYKDFKIKLSAASLPMFQLHEQEKTITNKEDTLIQKLMESQAKSMAYKQGLIVR